MLIDQSTKDIIAGFVSGWTQVFIMQPFELVKIRLQTQTEANPYYKGMADCFKKISKEEGMTSFYKGNCSIIARHCHSPDWHRFPGISHVLHLSDLQKILFSLQNKQERPSSLPVRSRLGRHCISAHILDRSKR
jgi:hypothetical protein